MKGSYTDNRPDPVFYGSSPEMPVTPLDLSAAIVLIVGQMEQIATLKGEIADLQQAQECSEEFAEKELERYKNAHEAAERELTKIQRYLNDLLAIIHRDGGHYQAEHGYEKAVRDAINVISQQREQIATLKVDVEKQVIYISNLNDELADERERADDADKETYHLKAEIEKLKLEMNRMVRY